jgi:hypothetical protein
LIREPVARCAADFHQAVDNLLRYSPHDLTLFSSGEGLPQVIKAVKSGTTFGGGSARVTFYLYQRSLCTLARRRYSRHHARRTAAGYDNIELPYRQFFRRLFVVITKVNINL